MSPGDSRRRPDEDGAVAITTALVLIVLILIASFLVDLGATRADARTDQTLADTAVMAASLTDGTSVEQCKAAVTYFAANTEAGSAVLATELPKCDALPTTCTESPSPGTSPVTTSPIIVGEYTMTVTFPVEDTDAAMQVQTVEPENDGAKCDRIKVQVTRSRDYTFAPAGGATGPGLSVADAVAIRLRSDLPDLYASLIVLEREACLALDTTGGGNIDVVRGDFYDHDDDATTPDVQAPGVITVDTTATGGTGSENCNTGNTKAIIAPASGFIRAADHIYSYGLLAGNSGNVYNSAHVPSRMTPEPEPGIVAGRRQVDWLFNCLSAYPDADTAGYQRYPADEHRDAPPAYRHGSCDETDSRPPYVDELHAALRSGTLTSEGFHETPTGACEDIVYEPATQTLTFGATVTTNVPPRLHVRCSFGSNFTMNVTGMEYVVFDKPIDTDPTLLRIHGNAASGVVTYFRSSSTTNDGGISVTGGTVDLRDIFVYVDSRGARNQDVPINVAGNATLTWRAPTLASSIPASCDAYDAAYLDGNPVTDPGLPTAGCFAPLALWSNSQKSHSLAGSGGVSVGGSFFTPNAVQFIGGGGVLDFHDSQFFASYLRTTGGGTITLKPNPDTNIPIEPPAPALIR